MAKSGKKFFYFLVISLVLAFYLTSAVAEDKVLGQRYQLPNGLIWLFSQQTELPMVTVNLTIKAGALFDPPQKEGLANLTAALLRYGTKTRTAQQIAESMDFYRSFFFNRGRSRCRQYQVDGSQKGSGRKFKNISGCPVKSQICLSGTSAYGAAVERHSEKSGG